MNLPMKEKAQTITDNSVTKAQSDTATYTLDKRRYVVTTVFNEDGQETIGNILIRLMKADLSAS